VTSLPTARLIPTLKPGDPEWAKRMSASKVGAALGLSPFESPYSLWQRMAGRIPWEDDDQDILKRGHYLEPALLQWMRDQHPNWQIDRTGSWVHADRDWQVATPDGLAMKRNVARDVTALIEAKTSNNDWEWGTPLTDEVPPYYRAQALWQMDVTGIHVCHFAVLTSFMEFREYVVEYDADDAAWVREQMRAFLDSVAAGVEPDIDDSSHTYEALRQLHPDIDDVEVELEPDLAVEFLHALRQHKAAEKAYTGARSRVAAAMGRARRARFADITYATRQTRAGSKPFVVPGRGLTDKEEANAA
jgi:putative phage-type endonuclease